MSPGVAKRKAHSSLGVRVGTIVRLYLGGEQVSTEACEVVTHIYLSVRCQQIFLVNERRGSVVAINRDRNPLLEPEQSREIKTFADGRRAKEARLLKCSDSKIVFHLPW